MSRLVLPVLVVLAVMGGCQPQKSASKPPATAPTVAKRPETPKPFRPWKGLIAVCDSTETTHTICIVKPDGSHRAVSVADDANELSWSPGGTYLAYRPTADQSLYVLSHQGKTPKKLGALDDGRDSDFHWTPDGRAVLAGVYQEAIYVYTTKGSRYAAITTSGGNYDHNPTLSFDGHWVYFLHHEWGTQCTIYRIGLPTLLAGAYYEQCQELAQIQTDSDEQVELAPLKNGKVALAYSGQFAVLDPIRRQVRTIDTSSNGFYYLQTSPDGRYLSCFSDDLIRILDANTLETVKTLDDSIGEISIGSYVWSPDSQALALVGMDGRICLWWFADQRLQVVFQLASKACSSITWTR